MPLPGRVDLWLPPLLLMAVIFLLSAQPSLDSGLGWIDLVGRKLIHLAVYALLCLLWWRLLRTGMSAGRAALVACILSSLYAATDELHQSFVTGRHGSAAAVSGAPGDEGRGLASVVERPTDPDEQQHR